MCVGEFSLIKTDRKNGIFKRETILSIHQIQKQFSLLRSLWLRLEANPDLELQPYLPSNDDLPISPTPLFRSDSHYLTSQPRLDYPKFVTSAAVFCRIATKSCEVVSYWLLFVSTLTLIFKLRFSSYKHCLQIAEILIDD